MNKTFRDYFPEKQSDVMLVQARVPKALGREARELLDQEGRDWNECMTACLSWFIDKAKAERRGRKRLDVSPERPEID